MKKILFIYILLALTSQAHAGLSDSWNKFREKHIDPAGDKAADTWNKTREKHIDPIGDAENVKEGLKATGKAVIRTIKFTGETSWDVVEKTYDVANESIAKPVAKYFKKNWDELQAEQASKKPNEYVEKIRVVNELASDILITSGKTGHTNPEWIQAVYL